MKKLVVILAAVCILFAGAVGYISYTNRPADEEPAAEAEPVAETADAESVEDNASQE